MVNRRLHLLMWLLCSGLLSIPGIYPAALADDCSRCHPGKDLPRLARTAGISEKAVGVMDKGQLQNNTSNFGDLASFHVWFTNAGHWPREARSDRQYAFGLGLVVAVNDSNVIETVTQSMSRIQDWLPPDAAAGREYSGEIRAASDQTPFQASSDFRETWPYGYFSAGSQWVSTAERHWPGPYRVDVTALDPAALDRHPPAARLPFREGEFTSDRDIYCTYNDQQNARGSVGLSVEQIAYSYGRPYAEDFVFWELRITNTSPADLEDIHVGFYCKFRPDYDNHDYLNFIDSDGDGKRDLVYVYDLNNTPNKTWADTDDPLGMVGLRLYDTPGQSGIAGFHHFARGVSPTTDEELWALMTSDRSSPHLLDPDYYFHGSDPNLDYTGTDSLAYYYPSWLDEESGVELEGDGINYIISSGPFTLRADSTVTVSLALVMGNSGTVPDRPDTTDLMHNLRLANTMYRYYFQGSGPPGGPRVGAVPGDGRVTLYWSSEPSESSVDVLTGRRDFEGYKIFRSTDQGITWGRAITDAAGQPAGYVPLAIYDLENTVSGIDPAFPQQLGVNSGLAHSFTDSNLVNGVEYWYCVSAYDRGNQNPDSLEQSYLYPLGTSTHEPHTVAVIPGVPPVNQITAAVPAGTLEPRGGSCTGTVRLQIVDPGAITGHGYRITFTSQAVYAITGGDTTFGTGFILVDTTSGDTLFNNHILSDASGDNLPVTDGFRLIIQDSPTGVQSLVWTRAAGDTCTFDWRYQSIDPGSGLMLIQETVETFDDWRLTVTLHDSAAVGWLDLFSGTVQPEPAYLPLRIEIITDPSNPRDVTASSWLGEFALAAPEEYRRFYYSPPGWDLVPGGRGYLAGSPGWYEKHVDVLILEAIDTTAAGDTLANYLFLFTNNKPDSSRNQAGELEVIDARAPSNGDQFTLITYKPFRPGIGYRFGTTAARTTTATGNTLKNLRVVPDPYLVTNAWESGEFGKKLQFNHLPSRCTIRIYTLVGEHVATVEHDAPTGYEFWDMRTRNDQFIAPGVYLYHARTPEGHEAAGRFLVIK